VANFTVAGQAWISHRVAYSRRARSLGLFETSWAVALLIGAPAVALLINVFGWRGPFVALAVASTIAALVVAGALPRWAPRTEDVEFVSAATASVGSGRATTARADRASITSTAWLVMIGSATTAMAGLSVFVVSGSWLDDAFGVSTSGIGLIAIAFGTVELAASLTSAGVADSVGKFRSTIAGLVLLLAGLGVMMLAEGRLSVGLGGLLLFLLGFEFAFVTSLSLVSEAMPDARGTTLAMSNAVATVARAGGAMLSGWLFATHGIAGTAALSATSAVIASLSFVFSRRIRPTVASMASTT
jgi:predicted MFS family arabinose efflux permease